MNELKLKSNADEYYTVRDGDTIYSISIREGISVAQLKKLNHLNNFNTIYKGLKLRLRPSSSKPYPTSNHTLNNEYTTENDFIKTTIVQNVQPIPFPAATTSDKTNYITKSFQDGQINRTRSKSSSFDFTEVNGSSMTIPMGNALFDAAESLSKQISLSPIISMTSNLFNSFYGQPSASDKADDNATGNVSQQNIQFQESFDCETNESVAVMPRVFGQSKILSPTFIIQIMHQLPLSLRPCDWILLYSLVGNGTDLTTFYNRTKSHRSTILLVQTLSGEIFGGFNNINWHVSANYCKC